MESLKKQIEDNLHNAVAVPKEHQEEYIMDILDMLRSMENAKGGK